MSFLKKICFFIVVILVAFCATIYEIKKKDPQNSKDIIVKAIIVVLGIIATGLLTNYVAKSTDHWLQIGTSSSIVSIIDEANSDTEGMENSSLIDTEIKNKVNSSSNISSLLEVESGFETVSEEKESNIAETVSNIPQKQTKDSSFTAKAMIGKKAYATLQSAIDDSNCGDTVSVLSDIQENIRIDDEKDITIELNEYTISNNNDNTFYIEGYVSVVGGNIDNATNGKAAIVVERGGNAILRECEITRSREEKGNTYYTIVNRGNLVCENCDIENGSLKQYKDRKSAILNGYTHAGESILDYRNNKNKINAELKISDSKIYGGNNAIRNGIYSILNLDNCDLYGYEHAFSNRGEAKVENSTLYGVEAVFCDKKEAFHEDLTQSVQIKDCKCSSENGVFLDDKMLHQNGQIYTNVSCDFIPNVSYVDNGDGTYSIVE